MQKGEDQPPGLLACLVIRNLPSLHLRCGPQLLFPDALNCLQKKIVCYDHFKIPFLSDPSWASENAVFPGRFLLLLSDRFGSTRQPR